MYKCLIFLGKGFVLKQWLYRLLDNTGCKVLALWAIIGFCGKRRRNETGKTSKKTNDYSSLSEHAY